MTTRQKLNRLGVLLGAVVGAITVLVALGHGGVTVVRAYDQVYADSARVEEMVHSHKEMKQQLDHQSGQLDEVLRRLPVAK